MTYWAPMEPFKGGTQMSNIIFLQHSEEKHLNDDCSLFLDFLNTRKWAAPLYSTFPDRILMLRQGKHNRSQTIRMKLGNQEQKKQNSSVFSKVDFWALGEEQFCNVTEIWLTVKWAKNDLQKNDNSMWPSSTCPWVIEIKYIASKKRIWLMLNMQPQSRY